MTTLPLSATPPLAHRPAVRGQIAPEAPAAAALGRLSKRPAAARRLAPFSRFVRPLRRIAQRAPGALGASTGRPPVPPLGRLPALASTLMLLLLLALILPAVPVQAQSAPDADWWSAIRRDDVSAVQTRLLRGADPGAWNPRGNPALTQAVREQSWKVYDVLRRAPGIQVDQPNFQDETALMYLCILGETQRAADLIQAGARVNRLGWTPLHYAASKGQVDTARMLIQRGAIVNAPGPDGTTPLMMAALSGKPAIARLLLDHGADPTMVNQARETAADWALKRNSTAMAAAMQAAAEAVHAQRARQAAGQAPDTPQAAAPETETDGADGATSFSRYFDLDRFQDTPPGK
ncbi:ankyrin repeat domain-containing protein [Castellaniella hirudinis]|uniref:ankyrin repeat domain-containing protein n=1 Tax=Castellaniella hirudinis TaxID=1144617 RepID=UPI0039C47A2E